MKKKFTEYMDSINVPKKIQERAWDIYDFYKIDCKKNIKDIFISDYITEKEVNVFESILFFTSSLCMEAENFISEDDFDITSFENRIDYWNIKKKDYDFRKATIKSRLYITCRLIGSNLVIEFKATGINCDHLRDIFNKYIEPNLVKVGRIVQIRKEE